ncbi:hypothetical protein, partial [Streptomyces halstedii]|uniref:hypothetical protein n=1 Tax=Streptomyces halstedii TaxID=1944 RepID=UPI0019433A4B
MRGPPREDRPATAGGGGRHLGHASPVRLNTLGGPHRFTATAGARACSYVLVYVAVHTAAHTP